jgi:cell division protein FtsL
MNKFFNALLVLTVLISGFVLYSLEHATRGIERDIAATHRAMAAERESIRLLNAEWSSLTRPADLERMARQHLGLENLGASQIVRLDELGQKVPAEPAVRLVEEGKDPIAGMLEQVQ